MQRRRKLMTRSSVAFSYGAVTPTQSSEINRPLLKGELPVLIRILARLSVQFGYSLSVVQTPKLHLSARYCSSNPASKPRLDDEIITLSALENA